MGTIIIGREEKVKEKLKPAISLEIVKNSLVGEFEKYINLPYMIDEIYRRASLDLREFNDVKEYVPTSPNYPLQLILAVGGMSSMSLTENISYYKKLSTEPVVSEEDINRAVQMIARNNDMDLYVIFKGKNTANIDRYSNTFKKKLKLPKKLEERGFEGYEIHVDCRKTVEETLSVIDHFKGKNGKNLAIGEHDKEVWERTPEKRNKPYMIWENPNIDKKLEEELDEYLENNWLRTKEEFLDTTFREYITEFYKNFPEEYARGIGELRKTWPRFKEYEEFYKPKPI